MNLQSLLLRKTKPTLAEGPQSGIVVPVASERLEGGSVFLQHAGTRYCIQFKGSNINLFFPPGLLT